METITVCNACGSQVTFDPALISYGDPEWHEGDDASTAPYYHAACLSCDEDLYEFEVTEVQSSEALTH